VKTHAGIDGLAGLCPGGSVVTIGVFDGLHLGHTRVVGTTVDWARELGVEPVVVTFREHPDAHLKGRAPRLIISLPHRLLLLQRAGVAATVVLDFDERIRQITAEEFARHILKEGLAARGLVLGHDAALGRGREGTPERFRELGPGLGFTVRTVPALAVDRAPVSSTAIRSAIEGGDLEEAARMLGRPVSVLGTVVGGSHRGRLLGFPTANLDLMGEVRPPVGVYAVRVVLADRTLPGVCNIGLRPTFARGDLPEQRKELLEVHLLDFDADLYGQDLEVQFVARLRGERRFESGEALAEQIGRDVAQARRILGIAPA
jgi:riboflavin kinase/FMN adenylyltransferase